MGQPPQPEPRPLDLDRRGRDRPHGVPADHAVPHDDGLQHVVDLDQLDQNRLAQRPDQLIDLEATRGPAQRLTARSQGPLPNRLLQPAPLSVPSRVRLRIKSSYDVPQRSEISDQLFVTWRPHRRDTERGGSPPFAPDQQAPRIISPQRVAQSQLRELRAVTGRQRTKLGGSHREPMLVQRVESAATSRQHAAHILADLRSQGFAEPGRAASERRRIFAAASSEFQLALRGPRPSVGQCEPSGQQVRGRRFGGAKGI